jgi:hypothetical protein
MDKHYEEEIELKSSEYLEIIKKSRESSITSRYNIRRRNKDF